MANRARPALILPVLVLSLIVAACGGSAAPASPDSPGPVAASPGSVDAASDGAGTGPGTPAAPGEEATRDPDVIDHPTGATDVVLRVAEEGGFMRMEAVMARVPLFTLYGDGRVIVAASDASAKGQAGVADMPAQVLRETRLTEDQVQAVLRSALIDGMLGVAKETFPVMVMDVPTTVIEVHAGGVDKRVRAAGLSLEPQPGPDAQVLAALAGLVDRLRGVPAPADYQATASIAVLAETEPAPGVAPAPWPWPGLSPAQFAKPAPDDPFGFSTHLLSTAESEAAGIAAGAGGGPLTVEGPDGRSYAVVIRPALPDEAPAG